MYKYHAQENELREQASMAEPSAPTCGNQHTWDKYLVALDKYNAHIASLKQYDCSPQCRDVWEDGKDVKESEFRLTYHVKVLRLIYEWDEVSYDVYNNTAETHRMILAYPIQQEESEDELWGEVVGIIIKAHTYYTMNATKEFAAEMEKLKSFTIHRKQ